MKPGRERIRDHKTRSGAATVSIHVRAVAQMFNSLDPAPFWDRDLDRDAAQGNESDSVRHEHRHFRAVHHTLSNTSKDELP